jgi:hypothetical protein
MLELHTKYRLKDYLKVEVGLVENNYELIEKVEYFKELQI